MKKIIALLVLTVWGAPIANSQTHSQTLYWLRYQAVIHFSPQVSWSNDIDNRRFIDPDVQNQFIIHSRLHYRMNHWDFGAGLTYSLAYAAIPERGYQYSMSELRPVAEVSYELPMKKSTLSHRLRIDNRIFQEEPETSLLEESTYVMRLRYRIQLRIPLKRNESNVTTIGLRLADEVMVNTRENLYDQNRIYATGDFYLTPGFSIEAGYIYIHQQRFAREEFFSRHVLRFSLLHKINW